MFMPSARFMTATHVMTMLALAQRAGEEPVPATACAFSLGTNPVVVRRLVGELRDAGLVEASRGAGGGVRLARAAHEVTLADVAAAVQADELALARYAPGCPSGDCRIAPHIAAEVATRVAELQAAMRAQLAATTLDSLVSNVNHRMEVPA